MRSRIVGLALAIFCLASMSCAVSEGTRTKPASLKGDLSIYRITNEQAGHELVKTEQFLVPAGTPIPIKGLEFDRGVSALTPAQNLIVQQIFNSLEEITENTVNDTNAVRVAEFKKMEFEVRGYPDDAAGSAENAAVADARAKAVMDRLTYLGTPSWRLKAVGVRPSEKPAHYGRVDFLRIR